ERHLARHGSPERAPVSDVYLACACACGNSRAIAAFEKHFLPEAAAALERMRLPGGLADEALQTVRAKLLTGSTPKIAEYAGGGPLAVWVRVAAVRTALTLRRSQKRQRIVPAISESRIRDPSPDPELAFIKKRYRAVFKEALASAFAGLSERDRMLLRAHLM